MSGRGSSYLVPYFNYTLNTRKHWKSFGPISIRVSIPKDYYAVILPVPGKATAREDVTVHEINVAEPDGNLHVSLLRKAAFCPVSYYNASGRKKSLAKLQQALKDATHPAVIPLLRAAVARLHLKMEHKHRAWEAYLALKRDYPSFDAEKFVFANEHETRRTKKRHNWIEEHARSPKLDSSKKDFNTLGGMSQDDKRVMARRIMALTDLHRTPEEKIWASFLLCRFGVEPQKNLDRIVSLAEANDELILPVLKLLCKLTTIKTSALPFVLEHINRNPKNIWGDTYSHEWRVHVSAVSCLRYFTVPTAAPRLAELYNEMDDALVKQGIIAAFKNMKPPVGFELLAELGMPVEVSVSAVYSYIDTLVAIDKEKAIHLLPSLAEKHPAYASRILQVLSKLGDRSVMDKAIDLYNTAGDEETVGAAAMVLYNLKDPAVFERLVYRSDMPAWIGEKLVFVIREKGGGEHAFRFVEKHYLQHLRGKQAHNRCTSVYAFSKIGDKRALPYLREILLNTERKSDAVRAIGAILLDRRTKQNGRPAAGDLWNWMLKARDLDAASDHREAAIRKLVATGRPAFVYLMRQDPFKSYIFPSPSAPAPRDWLKRIQYLSRFGDVGMRHLLEISVGCNIVARTNLARLMSMFPRESRALLREAAAKGTDLDQRKTAVLALGLCGDKDAVPVLVGLLDAPAVRSGAIEALGRIGDGRSIPALAKLRDAMAMSPDLTLQEKAWLRAIDDALAALRGADGRVGTAKLGVD